jgi:hypothetical protein
MGEWGRIVISFPCGRVREDWDRHSLGGGG